jgi:hypothetical protein
MSDEGPRHSSRPAIAAAILLTIVTVGATGSPQTPRQTTGGKAGAAWSDITPLPGLPTGGYGPAGTVTRGYWGRLRATAFYFEDPAGRGLALVSMDLFAVPAGLHQSVARHFASAAGVDLPQERIVIAATHTHQGPGNYLSAEIYNDLGSAKPGFNRELRDFLLVQVIEAIESAIQDARSTTEASVDILTGQVDATLFRNRSPLVFMKDDNRPDILATLGPPIPADQTLCVAARLHDEPREDWKIDGCPRLRGVDRNVTLLRMRRGHRTHALALFVNVHPTVLAPKTALNSADLFGATAAALRERFGATPPIVGFFNGSEGDVVARRTTRTATDLPTMGESLARQVYEIHNQSTPTPIDLALGIHGRLHYAHAGDVEPSSGPPKARLASEAMAGVALLGGGEGDETFWHHFIWRRRGPSNGDQ